MGKAEACRNSNLGRSLDTTYFLTNIFSDMGGNQSTELDCQRIAEIALELNGQFSKEYSIAFKCTVLTRERGENCIPPSDEDSNLEDAPAVIKLSNAGSLDKASPATQNVKVGYLTKIGATVKNWKRRYFVAKNQSENFVVHYYESSKDLLKEKGSFNCCGYHVEFFTAEEEAIYGSYGIKLKPIDEAKRTWLFRADNEDEQNQWAEVFMNACRRTLPEQSLEDVYNEAFLRAFRVTRASYGYFGIFSIAGTEIEMLELLTNEVLHREILDDHLAISTAVSTSPVKKKSISQNVRQVVQKIVKPIVRSSWRNAIDSATGLYASFTLSVANNLPKIIENEGQIRKSLRERINELVEPYVMDVEHKVCMPILQSCFTDTVEAYEQALLGFNREMRGLIENLVKSPTITTMNTEFLHFGERLEQSAVGVGALKMAQKILWKMHSIDMVEMCGSTDHECITGYDLYLNAVNDLKLLMLNGAHTFSKMFMEDIIKDGAGNIFQDSDVAEEVTAPLPRKKMPSEEGYASHNSTVNTSVDDLAANNHSSSFKDISSIDDSTATVDVQTAQLRSIKCRTTCNEILHNVITRLNSDCKTTLHLSFVKLLTDALESTVQELIIAPSYEVVLPAQKLIKKEVKEFIMLHCLGEDMVRAAVQDFIFEFTQDLALESSSRLNIIAVQLLSD